MDLRIKIFDFKALPIEVEVKDLRFVKEYPRLFEQPHKATFYQIISLTKGMATFRIDFRDVTIKENEILVISSNQLCEFDVKSDYSGKMILFTSSFFSITEHDTNFLYSAEILNPVNLNKTVSVCPQLTESLIKLLDEELKKPEDKFQIEIAQSYLRIILLETERQRTESYLSLTNTIGRKFFNAVEQSFREEKNAEFYIAKLAVNEKALAKQIRELTGKTPKKYIDTRIILEAKRLLVYSSMSIKEIGCELGFDEPTNFGKYFRKHTNVTPKQFRELTSK